jgi:hypothetical protein
LLHWELGTLHLNHIPLKKELTLCSAFYCADLIPATLQQNPTDVNCTASCPGKSTKACGGPVDQATVQPSALSLTDSQPPEPVMYPRWKYEGCVEHYSSLGNLTHVATVGMLTVERFLMGCDKPGLNYTYAGLSGMCVFSKPVHLFSHHKQKNQKAILKQALLLFRF